MKNLYVGNLPHSTTEAQLRTAFEAHGAVERINILNERQVARGVSHLWK
jgi:RNA recognition motif-containing protein